MDDKASAHTSDPSVRVAEIEAREKAATAGPWERRVYEGVRDPKSRLLTVGSERTTSLADYLSRENAEFIAHARDDIPWLLAERADLIERLHAAEAKRATLVEASAQFQQVIAALGSEVAARDTTLDRIRAAQEICDSSDGRAIRDWVDPERRSHAVLMRYVNAVDQALDDAPESVVSPRLAELEAELAVVKQQRSDSLREIERLHVVMKARTEVDDSETAYRDDVIIPNLEREIAARDAVIADAPHGISCAGYVEGRVLHQAEKCDCWKSTAPASVLSGHDTEVAARAWDKGFLAPDEFTSESNPYRKGAEQ